MTQQVINLDFTAEMHHQITFAVINKKSSSYQNTDSYPIF